MKHISIAIYIYVNMQEFMYRCTNTYVDQTVISVDQGDREERYKVSWVH